MRHYKSNADACYGVALIFGALLALLFSAATIDYVFNTGSSAPRHPIYYPLAVLFIFVLIARQQLFHSGIRWWVYLGILIPAFYVALFMTDWFRDELHDFALIYFRSHGRFGCHDDRYRNYIFRDDTAPWILFSPLMVATVFHWLYRSPIFLAQVKKHAFSFFRWSTTYESRPTD